MGGQTADACNLRPFGLIAFCAKDYFETKISTTTTVAGWTTFSLSLFMALLIVLSLLHANSDYTRSREVLKQIRAKTLLPEEISRIFPDENATPDALVPVQPDPTTPTAAARGFFLKQVAVISSLWHKGFGYIGWQFIAIMVFALLLVLTSLLVALQVTVSAAHSAFNE
jgi:hypothetical protein